MLDSINAGMPSDRLEITWNLNDARVLAAISGDPLPPTTPVYPPEDFLLYTDVNGNLRMGEVRDPLPRWHFVEIPYNLTALKRDHIEQAKAWQLALRQAMHASLSQGNAVVDFVTAQGRCWYVLG
jgi:predicted GNAT superfamily acetyltransferase